jgi:hypothetical protein
MKPSWAGFLAVLALLVAGAGARAQAPTFGSANQPAVSPYLNLLRAGAPPALNWFNIAQPQQQFSSSINTLQQQVNTNQAAITTGMGVTTGPLVTGHMAYFGNYYPYYNIRAMGAMGAMGTTGMGRGGLGGGMGYGLGYGMSSMTGTGGYAGTGGLPGGMGYGMGAGTGPGAGGFMPNVPSRGIGQPPPGMQVR